MQSKWIVAFGSLVAACGASGQAPAETPEQPQIVETAEFSLPGPAGYKEITASYKTQQPDVLAAFVGKDSRGEVVVISLERAQIPRWVIEPTRCAERASMVVNPSPRHPDPKASLRHSAIVDWAGDKACEFDFDTSFGGPRLITERLDPVDPDGDGWMLLCQHNDDARAMGECRETRARFVLKKR